ncbi:hypothetical protein D1AOALGA4SA_5868 [Olavius algarvensis Delta 1 endosymbiont]|nr:hypothetical protein D1AOALGA4SA_5868 [Olavius algarvensis Delta 1 endosymbiont]
MNIENETNSGIQGFRDLGIKSILSFRIPPSAFRLPTSGFSPSALSHFRIPTSPFSPTFSSSVLSPFRIPTSHFSPTFSPSALSHFRIPTSEFSILSPFSAVLLPAKPAGFHI